LNGSKIEIRLCNEQVAGNSNVSIMGMVRMASSHEPKTGLKWLVDDGSSPPNVIGGYHALLMYRGDEL
jgi:hypothetical protein